MVKKKNSLARLPEYKSRLCSFLKHTKGLQQCPAPSNCPRSISSHEPTSSRLHRAIPAVRPVTRFESRPATPVCSLSPTWSPYYIVPVAVFCAPSCRMSHSGFSQAACLPLLALNEGPASLPRAYPLHRPRHQGCLCDPRCPPLRLDRSPLASLITFPKVGWLHVLRAPSHSHRNLTSSKTKSRGRITCAWFCYLPSTSVNPQEPGPAPLPPTRDTPWRGPRTTVWATSTVSTNVIEHSSSSAPFRHQWDLEGDANHIASDLGQLPLHPAEDPLKLKNLAQSP